MTKPEPYLTVRALRPLVAGLRQLRHDAEPLLKTLAIEPACLADPDARVPMRVGTELLRLAAEAFSDPDIGLHLAEHVGLGEFDVHFYAMVSSPDLGTAYERVCRYQRLIHETTRLSLEVEGERAILRHRLPGGIAVPRQSAEFIVAAWVRAGRAATGTDWAPLEVRFAHAGPEDAGEHERFFGAPVLFATGENALVMPAPVLALPCTAADPSLLAVLDRYAADRLERASESDAFADRARAALAEDLRGGQPSARRLASRLNTSVRTLNRALAAEGTSYRKLLDDIRRETAVRLLRDDRVSISEVAFLAGFSELSAFHRAFKKWTGKTPAGFRRLGKARPRA